MQNQNTTSTIKEYCFIPGGAIYFSSSAGQENILYTYTDHLGSITQVTDASGNLLAEFSYDAWGHKRDPETWVPYPAGFQNPQGVAIQKKTFYKSTYPTNENKKICSYFEQIFLILHFFKVSKKLICRGYIV